MKIVTNIPKIKYVTKGFIKNGILVPWFHLAIVFIYLRVRIRYYETLLKEIKK
jgi:hypothetical protein